MRIRVSASLLATGEPVSVAHKSNGRVIFGDLPTRPPHPAGGVIKVEFDGVPEALPQPDKAAWLAGRA